MWRGEEWGEDMVKKEERGGGRRESEGTHVAMSTSVLGVSQLNWSLPLNDLRQTGIHKENFSQLQLKLVKTRSLIIISK